MTARSCSSASRKIFFQISGAGHEALLVAAGMAMKPGYDWFFPYYRDRALCLTLGNTPEEQFLQAVGSVDDPASGGRQMPSHWSSPKLQIVSPSSSTATQCLHAVGCAEAGRYFARRPEAAQKPSGSADYRAFHDVAFHGDEVVYVSLGEGATSQGEFWEAISSASNLKLPVLFVVEDNGYAISVPVEVNTPGGNISRLVANFPNFHFEEVDGTDPVACLRGHVPRSRALPRRQGPLPLCTATSPGPIRTRSPTTSELSQQGRDRGRLHARSSAQDADATSARGHSRRARVSSSWSMKSMKKSARLPNAPFTRPCLRFPPYRVTSIRKTGIRRATEIQTREPAHDCRQRTNAPWPT